jgi:hypothetical protein
MTNNIGRSPIDWRNFSKRIPLPAFRLKPGDLKRLFQIVNAKQFEYRDKFMATLFQMQGESDSDYAARRQRVFDAFVTSVSITEIHGDEVHGNSEAFFDSPNIPEKIRNVFMSTASVPQAILGKTPLCNIEVLLDFSQPSMLNFSGLPTLPTPNGSNFAISADDESWSTSASAKLGQFFDERKTTYDWLHRAGIYDALLVLLGIPLCLWAVFRVSDVLDKTKVALPSLLTNAIYIYVFILALYVFRILFSYTRWIFPKVELDSDLKSSPLRHRGLWAAIIVPLVVGILYDVITKLLF